MSTIVCYHLKHKTACSTVESSMNWGMLCTWHSILPLRLNRDAMGSQYTMALRYPHNQMSQRFKLRDLGDQDVGNCLLMILSLNKWWWSRWFTQWAMCGEAASCINIVVVSHGHIWRTRIMDCSNNEVYRSQVKLHVTLPVACKCTATISVTTESSACNFLQLDLQDSPTLILPVIGCEDISNLWSTMILLHRYPTLKCRTSCA